MELPLKLLVDITGTAPGEVEPDDRRKSPRVPVLSRAVVYPDQHGIGHSAVVSVRDVSVHGVGFVRRERMSAGDEFVLQLPCRSGDAMLLRCKTQRCQLMGSGDSFVVGATFLQILQPMALDQLGEAAGEIAAAA